MVFSTSSVKTIEQFLREDNLDPNSTFSITESILRNVKHTTIKLSEQNRRKIFVTWGR
jgi:hypothetical protein